MKGNLFMLQHPAETSESSYQPHLHFSSSERATSNVQSVYFLHLQYRGRTIGLFSLKGTENVFYSISISGSGFILSLLLPDLSPWVQKDSVLPNSFDISFFPPFTRELQGFGGIPGSRFPVVDTKDRMKSWSREFPSVECGWGAGLAGPWALCTLNAETPNLDPLPFPHPASYQLLYPMEEGMKTF